MLRSKTTDQTPDFAELSLRFLVGIVTLVLPILVVICSNFSIPSSISGSYYTGARDPFVGSLFMVATLLFAIQGHRSSENWIAKLGSLAAIVAAVCPTSCDTCQKGPITSIHFIAGGILFGVIAYFCLIPFKQNADKKDTIKSKRRSKWYRFLGLIIIGCIIFIAISDLLLPSELRDTYKTTFLGEGVALWAFSFAWLIASKIINFFSEKGERLVLYIALGKFFRVEI